ncbi:MAG: hypothetical protein EOO28_16305 [Comamonadaceae bacterium]|nr:MAG: hypothetical protein EOO28_16305 [Comamonadaceae bacterium]
MRQELAPTGTAPLPPSADALPGLVRDLPDLLLALCVFNENPADYLALSRRAEFFPVPPDAALWNVGRARRHLSREILARIGGEACFDTQRAEWPLALMDRTQLDRLARHIAAALVGARVRRSISRAEVLHWREWLTPEAHDFALKRAGLLPVSVEAEAAVGSLDGTAESLGHAWLRAACSTWPDGTAQRFLLKLPSGEAVDTATVDAALAWRLVSSVLSIVEARWCSLFVTMRA